ncbi:MULTISPECIES: hypothetical protein [unclassified Sphingobium]|uniref:hypothetical protein n=1 Tax=unclassified Sphingobium TaxID=2611147 RepID=UPI002225A831|nr:MULTISPECIES: hypothetical protein [unclassified Sphingobium]MCW2382237.1 hypothetical protein [Sphingobium sp. B2D3B]MCW2397590.1 hypothetical protein [Sphingobium sp. B2D3C]
MGHQAKIVAAILICIAGFSFNLLSFDSFIFFGLPMVAGVAVAWANTRRHADWRTIDQATDVMRIYFGGHLLWSCLRFWFTDMQPSGAPMHPIAGPFLASLFATGIFPAVKVLEGIVGVMLLSNRFVPLALVLEVPTSMTVFYLNTFITARLSGLLTGPTELGVNVLLMLAYFQHYRPMLRVKPRAAPPWEREDRLDDKAQYSYTKSNNI